MKSKELIIPVVVITMFALIVGSVFVPHTWAAAKECNTDQKQSNRQMILDRLTQSLSRIDGMKGYTAQVEKMVALEKFNMPGWIYMSVSLIKDKKAERVLQIMSNGTYVVPFAGVILDLKENINVLADTEVKEDVKVISGGRLIYGSPDAKHRVTIFSDLWCRYCNQLKNDLDDYIKTDAPKDLAIYTRYAPTGENNTFYSQLYEGVRKVGGLSEAKRLELLAYLKDADVFSHSRSAILQVLVDKIGDRAIVDRLHELTKTDNTVTSDVIAAAEAGVRGVPYIVVDGTGIPGYNPEKIFELIEETQKD